ncbi:MAG: NACHT domain-containing protein [Clostridia bacterium]|nr:NACHT domain-containing protein [Clostridia bacterium]
MRSEYFICFRGDADLGGAIGAELYRTLNDRYQKNTYFSSQRNRTFGTNYRKEEERAIDECDTFIIVLTDGFIEGLTRENDEVLYELKTVLCYPDKHITAVAHKNFNWTAERKSTLDMLLGKDRAERIYYIDYVTYEGARSYADYTEKVFLKSVGINEDTPIISEIKELKEKLIAYEVENLKKAHASSTLFMKMDTIIKDFYIEPKLTLNGMPYFDNLAELVGEHGKQSIIAGESGSGKSTLMYRLFLDLASKAQNGELGNQIPLFKSLNGAKELNFDYAQIIGEMVEKLSLQVDKQTLEAFLNNTSPIYMYDALDEKSTELNSTLITESLRSIDKKATLILTMRQSFFKGFYSEEISSIVDNVLMVKPFPESSIVKYSVNFLIKARGLSDEEANTIVEKIKGQKIFSKILVLTYYLATSDFDDMEDALCVTGALGNIINSIIKRERDKKMIALTPAEGTLALKSLSWLLYSTRRKKLLTRDKLQEKIATETYLNERDIRALLDIFTMENESGTLTFIHEMFKEYLIARDFVDRILEGKEVGHMLDRTFNKEINAFITDLFEEEGADEICDCLMELYEDVEETDYVKVLSLFNHMHRLNRFKRVARFVRRISEETDDVAMRILCLHSLLACGDESDEQKYYDEFMSDERFALLNCGMALRYYNDDRTDIEIPYYDDGELSWRKCFISYKAHLLNENKLKHYYRIRRINILSAKKFIEIRRECDSEVAEFYSSVEPMLKRDDSEFGKLVLEAYYQLMETIKKYKV